MAVADFDGTGDYIDLEPGLDLTGAFTIWAVIKREANSAWHAIATWQTGADAFRVSLALTNGNRLQLATNDGVSSTSVDSSSGASPFTIQTTDGWCIVVAKRPAGGGSTTTLSKFTAAGGWVHTSSAGTDNPGTIGAGKLRVGRYQNTDDFNGRIAAVGARNGYEATQTEVETLDGGNATTWLAAFTGNTSANTDVIEPGMNGGSARANWSAACPSRNGLIDATAFGGNGTIVTGDDPASTVYTVGVTGGGSESKSGSDSVAATDTASLQRQSTAADSAAATDTAAVTQTQQKAASDTASFADDDITVGGGTDESGTVTDTASVQQTTAKTASDSAAATDTASGQAAFTRTDQATVADQAAVAAQLSRSDSAAVSDASTLGGTSTPSATDAGTIADTAAITASPARADSGVLTDAASVQQVGGTTPTASDQAAVSDAASVAVTVAASDQATGNDTSQSAGPPLVITAHLARIGEERRARIGRVSKTGVVP